MFIKAETFRKRCNKISERLLGVSCFDKADSYNVEVLLPEALASGQTPSRFVREVFAEDFASIEYDKSLRRG